MDKVTKLLLALIAVALWAQIAMTIITPERAGAQSDGYIASIAQDIGRISKGLCLNSKLC